MHKRQIADIYRKQSVLLRNSIDHDDEQLFYISTQLPEDKNASILDAGCGTGAYATYLKQKGYSNITCVDLYHKPHIEEMKFVQSSIESLPFEDQTFDLIYCNSVVYYTDISRTLEEFRRVLRPKGTLIFSSHTKYSLFTFIRLFRRDILKSTKMRHLSEVHFISADHYRKNLERLGMKVKVQDGIRVSFFLYRFYRKLAFIIKKRSGIKLPLYHNRVHRGLLGKIRSEIAYHCVFITEKK